ncbi:MAG: hypothetical protein ACE5F4_02645, partial [Candidatus Paceibacteria bacterium]
PLKLFDISNSFSGAAEMPQTQDEPERYRRAYRVSAHSYISARHPLGREHELNDTKNRFTIFLLHSASTY